MVVVDCALFPRYMAISVENRKIFPPPSIPLGIGYRRYTS